MDPFSFRVPLVMLLLTVSVATHAEEFYDVYNDQSISNYETQISSQERSKNYDVQAYTVVKKPSHEISASEVTITTTSVMTNDYKVKATHPYVTVLTLTVTTSVMKPYTVVHPDIVTVHPKPYIVQRKRNFTSTTYVTSVRHVVKHFPVTEENTLTVTQTDVSTVIDTLISAKPQYVTEVEIVSHTSYVPITETKTTVSYSTTTKTHFQEVGVTQSLTETKVLLHTEWVTKPIENWATLVETTHKTEVVSECSRHYFTDYFKW